MVGSTQVDAEVDDDAGSVTSGGVSTGEEVMVDDFDVFGMMFCFLETVEGITRELCSLLLRTCSKEIIVD